VTLIKICGITNLEDARDAAEAGADALGFNFYRGSRRYIEPREARRIIEELPASILSVGVFVNEDEPEALARKAREAGVALVQLHGEETPDYCRRLGGLRVVKALRVRDGFDPTSACEYEAEAILLDAFAPHERGGTGLCFDWSVARLVRERVPALYLAGGLKPETVAEAIRLVEPFAVDVCSGVERAPGRKDSRRLRAFIEAARFKT
jgi:phosphoribosylanthranilate isomerase